MAQRYRNAYRDELDNDEDEIEQELETLPEPETPEEKTFKQRYSDLRRYQQQKEAELQKKLDEKERQIAELSKQNFKLPKSEEEVKEWAEKYPDVAAIIRTLAIKEAQNIQSGLEDRLKKVDELERHNKMQAALNKIIQVHPDFYDLRNDQSFHDWAQAPSTPKWVKEALYENDEDAQVVIDAVDLYKMKKQINTKESAPKEFDRKGAATAVKTNSPAPKTAADDDAVWSESKVEKLSDREFEKHEEEIMEAMRTGKFVYDISGGAR